MKRAIMILLCLALAGQLHSREVINMNRRWSYSSGVDGSGDNALTVNLPHTWNSDALAGRNDYYRGVGNYIKEVRIPIGWRNKRVFIRFGAAGTSADLFVNGRHGGNHRGGYTAFTFEITSLLNYGENNLFRVVVNNSIQMDLLPTGGDINIYGGLYRDVELIVSEPSMVSLVDYSGEGIYLSQRSVTAAKAEVNALVKIDGLRDRSLEIDLAVTDDMYETVYQRRSRLKVPTGGKGEITVPVEIENPRLWNGPDDPYLYNVAVKVWDGDILCDSVSVPLGLRTFSADPRHGFLLNGEPYPLRGVAYYEDRAMQGNALRPENVAEDIDMMVEMGVNAIRAAAYPHNKEFYRECDRRGIIVWSDLPLLGPAYATDIAYVESEAFMANGRNQLREMIYQNYNHPSIVMWGMFSDLTMRGDNPIPYIEEINSIARIENPGRLTVASSNVDGRLNFITDLISWDQHLGWVSGMPADISIWLGQLSRNWGSLCSAVSYGAGASVTHQGENLARPDFMRNWHPENWQTYFHEQYYTRLKDAGFLWGQFISNMYDRGAAGRDWGDGTGIDDRGLVTFDRRIRKDAFFFYKANWNLEERFVHIAEKRWNKRAGRKQTIKVFSNMPRVELIVNGVSRGIKPGIDGTFIWPDMEMERGGNTIEARAPGIAQDSAVINIDPNLSIHKIY